MHVSLTPSRVFQPGAQTLPGSVLSYGVVSLVAACDDSWDITSGPSRADVRSGWVVSLEAKVSLPREYRVPQVIASAPY